MKASNIRNIAETKRKGGGGGPTHIHVIGKNGACHEGDVLGYALRPQEGYIKYTVDGESWIYLNWDKLIGVEIG